MLQIDNAWILNERDSRHEHVLNVARQMMTAARTAPKGKGIDIIETAIVTECSISTMTAIQSLSLLTRTY